MGLGTWMLVKLSDLCAVLSPANMSRYESEQSYMEWQFRNARWTYENLFKHHGQLAGKTAVDLGCGDGGKTHFYAGLDPKTIVGIDLDPAKTFRGKAFRHAEASTGAKLRFVAGSVEEIPFRDDGVDLCLSEDGFEHFPSPPDVLGEANRILKPGGRFLILFEPYFRAGGPHLYNWIRLPWAHLLFSDETMIEAARTIAKRAARQETPSRETSSRETAARQVEREIHQFRHFINKITLRKFKQYLLVSENWRLICFHTFCTNGLFRPFIGIPILAEMFVSVYCVLEKAPGQRIGKADFVRADERLGKTISLRDIKGGT